ncbi:MAG TPA: acetylornithine/succinylornithine family transaminase [Gaiellaceae bacterium]|nr:acetylornithine/succinylornithine family transaminase [Gaiellaceae bacterium]
MTEIAPHALFRASDDSSQGREALMPTYPRGEVTFVSGGGCTLTDARGRSYLDFGAGIAVVSLGHRHPAPLAAAHAQLDRLWHASNLYWTEPQAALAEKLAARLPGAQSFLCNSGTEAIEAAIKLARLRTGKPGIVALDGSFHGRSTGALAATGQPGKRSAFEPLLPGVRFAKLNDVESLALAIGEDTGLVLLEVVQGEGGVRPADARFVQAAARLAAEAGALLCVDEIQTGVGRTGTFFAFEQVGVTPDLVTMAKALANGLPIGALLATGETFAVGDHGSTFGGNPVVCAAACAVLDEITDDLLANVQRQGERITAALAELPGVVEVRGAGLLIGVETLRPAAELVTSCHEQGLVVLTAGEHVLRLAPPLVVGDAEVDDALSILQEVLQ